jgi:hypothetical protein
MVVVETAAPEQSLEEVVHTIKQSVIGSKATVAFGDLKQISKQKRQKTVKSGPSQQALW